MFDLAIELEKQKLVLNVYDYYQDIFGHKSWSAAWKFKGAEICRIYFSDLGSSSIRLHTEEYRSEVNSIYLDACDRLRESPLYALTINQKLPRGYKGRLVYLARMVVGEKMFLSKLSYSMDENILMVDPTDITKIAAIRVRATSENIKIALEQYPGLILINQQKS